MNLSDYEALYQKLDTQELWGSDSCIANLFLLQEKYGTEIKIHKDILFRYYHGGENRTGYGFPIPLEQKTEKRITCQFLKDAFDFIKKDARERNREISFCLITQEQKNILDTFFSTSFASKRIQWKANRDDSDYIYLQKNLADLPGAIYQKKRNHVSRFNRTYGIDWEFKSYPENEISDDIIFVAEKWYEEKIGEDDPVLKLELKGIRKALENTSLLKLRGGVLYISGIPSAMTLASPVSDSVLDVIYEKAYGEAERDGAYAVINHEFAKTAASFLYLNREEDMGVEGLRKAKLSYKPTIILDKFYGKLEG